MSDMTYSWARFDDGEGRWVPVDADNVPLHRTITSKNQLLNEALRRANENVAGLLEKVSELESENEALREALSNGKAAVQEALNSFKL